MKSPSVGDSTIASMPSALRALDQRGHRAVAGRIVVAGDVEPAQRVREQDGGEMGRRERCRPSACAGSAILQRQHGLDAFAGCHDVASHAEADGVTEKIAHRAPRRVDRRLAERVSGRSPRDRARCDARR